MDTLELAVPESAAPMLSASEVLLPVLRCASDPSGQLVAAKCLGLLAGYDARWKDAPYRIDAVESVMTAPLFNPETQRTSRSFLLAGKLDVRATEIATGAKVIFDHKTTSSDIADLNAPFWRILAIEGQVSQYMLLEWLNGNKVDCAVWDVVRKPSISPKLLPALVVTSTLRDKKYCGWDLPDEDCDILRSTNRETPLMYAARVAQDCIQERPGWYFQRRKTPRLDSEIAEYAREVWGHSKDILAARQAGRWPRNSGACFTFNTPCEYLGVCSGHDSLDSGAWTKREWVHPELPVLSDGDLLTNSRIRCFQTCQRKHQLRYELGMVKVDAEQREALFFGDLFHRALEAYFLALQSQQQKG